MEWKEKSQITLLIVDDDKSNLSSLEKIFQREGMKVFLSENSIGALEILRNHHIDVMLTDLVMPDMDGIELLKISKQLSPDTEVVVMTAYGNIEYAVAAMKEGAYDFVEKPLKKHEIIKCIKKAAEKRKLVVENKSLKQELSSLLYKKEIIGNSTPLRKTLDIATQAALSNATVLILGESGTGKELIAKFIHQNSMRSNGPFVVINCAAIPETILEAELFGYEKGAFTGATQKRVGRIAQADGGTLFLDEVGEIPLHLQVKLLRVLQEGEIEPLGGKTTHIDIRIIAATNKDLYQEVKEGRFREDLFYRLNVITITVPPLRQRLEDIPLLVNYFIKVYNEKNNKTIKGITDKAIEKLMNYYWPGNVRELENVIERAVVLCKNEIIDIEDLPDYISKDAEPNSIITIPIGLPLEEIEKRVIRETLKFTKGDKKLASKLLGIATRTIYRKLSS